MQIHPILAESGAEVVLVSVIAIVACIIVAIIGCTIVACLAIWRNPKRPKNVPPSPAGSQTTAKPACPRCGCVIEPGAPQGLCPRCLMQAGMESVFGEPPKPASPPPKIEEIAPFFPQLEILGILGQGGMGVVYKARQPQLDRIVALKILSPERSADPAFAERFSREAKALAKLNHPNIVSVFDFGQTGNYCYLIMEYVDGVNLWQMEHSHERLTAEQALAIVPKICDALQYAHDQGIVHRDIKPANILLDTKGNVKIADFGLAKLLGKESPLGLTQSRASMGTPHYMAPEQIEKPLTVDHRADIYSLGVVFYEMLTGELPLGRFSAPSAKIQMDVRLDEVVLRTLEKEPDRRYQQASQIRCDVETIATHPGANISAPPPQAFFTPKQPEAPSIDKVRSKIFAPSVALIVFGVLQFIPLLMLPLTIMFIGHMTHEFTPEGEPVVAAGGLKLFALVSACLLSAIGGLMIAGGIKMKNLRAYPLAIVASLAAMLHFPLGLIPGIWALIVLLRPEVREAFLLNKNSAGPKD